MCVSCHADRGLLTHRAGIEPFATLYTLAGSMGDEENARVAGATLSIEKAAPVL